MQRDSSQGDRSVALAPGTVGGALEADATVALPRLRPLGARLRLPRPRVTLTPSAGRFALAGMILGALVVVAFSAAGPSVLVPRSEVAFPAWLSGPLHGLFGRLNQDPLGMSIGLSALLLAMGVAYGVALASVRTLSMRTIAICIVALHLILFLGPPLPLTDIFNYLGYARLGALHHLNPYTHVIAQASHDPVFRFTSWHNLRSPYGPAFTVASYPLAFLSVPVAYWVLKAVTMVASLAVIALVWRCARQLGRDPRFAVLFVAANPVVLIYALGGFHNDVFMLLPALGAISLLLERRDRSAGALLMLAVAVKFTAVLLLPFLLIAARPARRRLQVLVGATLAAIPLALGSVAAFGLAIPNLSDQSTLLTDFSIPNVFGLVLGLGGGTPGLLRVASVLLVLAVAYFVRRRGNWLVDAGWSTFALIASLAWLVPWYVIWLLPLAALGTSVRLRRATLALTAYLVLAFMPATGVILSQLNIKVMGSTVGQASKARQQVLEQ
jgi:Glycosyltransferase family 87